MTDDLFDRCPACASRKMVIERFDKVVRIRGRRVVVHDVPAHVCTSCGERFLDARAIAYVERSGGVSRSRKRAPRHAA